MIGRLILFVSGLLMPGSALWSQTEHGRIIYDRAAILRQIQIADSLYARSFMDTASIELLGRKYQHILLQSEALQYRYGIVSGASGLGRTYAVKGEYEAALSSFRKAVSYCNARDSTRHFYPSLYNNIGNIYKIYGDYERAIKFYKQSIASRRNLPEWSQVVAVYINISALFIELEQYDQALYYLHKAERMLREDTSMALPKNKKEACLALTQLNIGICYYARQAKDTGKGNEYLSAAFRTARHFPYIRHAALTVRAEEYLSQDQPQAAIGFLRKALKLNRRYPNHSYASHNELLLNLGRAHFDLKNYALAEHYLKEGLQQAASSNIKASVVKAHQYLSELYAEQSDFERAYYHRTMEKECQDSVLTQEMLRNVNMMEIRYRTMEKDKEAAEQKLLIKSKEQELINKNYLINIAISGILLLMLTLISFHYHYRNKQKLQKNRIQLLEQQQKIVEMRSIMNGEEKERTRIARELHDSIMIQFSVVKMNLSSFIGEHAQNGKKELKDLMNQLNQATLSLRNTAHNLMPDMLLQEGLVAALDYFCDNCKESTGMDIALLHYGAIPRLEREFELSLYRIIQELIQNVIKHARATKAIIQLSFREGMLAVAVEDNGSGIRSAEMNKKTGLGLKSIEARVQAANGHMEIENQRGKGLAVHLEFDIRRMIRADAV